MEGIKSNRSDKLLILLIIYCAASLLHFVHNAVFIDDYPNLPNWITTAGVYIAWAAITSIGVIGYLLLRFGKRLAGLFTVAIYAVIGLDGLTHYSLAPISAHTFTMNLTIWLEAITAAMVLIAVSGLFIKHLSHRTETM